MREIKLIQPKRPKSKSWQQGSDISVCSVFAESWFHPSGLTAISNVEAPDKSVGPEYHISVTMKGKRCTSNQAQVALKAFDMEYADEDNHTTIARNYWRPVADHLAEKVCDCKEIEPTIKLDNGDFIYRPIDSSHQGETQ